MAFWGLLQSLFKKQPPLPLPGEGEQPSQRDTLSVIHDLSRLVRNDPEAIDIYLALGNLFRAQGDIERAVLIREGLIARPNLNTPFRARACFELGQDYHRAGVVDRALTAFYEAAKLGYPQDAVTAQLAELFAYAGDFEKAADEYGRLRHSLAQAHYLVRRARELFDAGEEKKAQKLLKRALRIYPGSVEAWSTNVRMAVWEGSSRNVATFLARGLDRISPTLHFLLLDALLDALAFPARGTEAEKEDSEKKDAGPEKALPSPDFVREVVRTVAPILEKLPPHVLIHYYGALLLREAGDVEGEEAWLEKALIVHPDFWAARLQSLAVSTQRHDLPPVFDMQVSYLAQELKHINRFVCTVCAFRENQVFYRCRRCGSWHSLAFRLSLRQ